MMNNLALSNYIKQNAEWLGFDYCGIAKAVFMEDDARRLEVWLGNGFNGQMNYMGNHFDLRTNPSKLVPGAKSVITLLLNYYPTEIQKTKAAKISKYAYGHDYHLVIRKKLNEFLQLLKAQIGDFEGRGFVDSAPVLERSWALRSGLGWIGKNGNLITKKSGSYFFIATLIIDVELHYDLAFANDHCGTCTQCIDQCPTEAILPNKVIDGSRCISYLTIELKEAIPPEFKEKMDGWIFGCDVCQDVCPWNRFAKPHLQNELKPYHEILGFEIKDWLEMEDSAFKTIFRNSPLKRTKFAGIQRNALFATKQTDEETS